MPVSLGELATRFGCELIGDPETRVSEVASLVDAGPSALTFLSNSNYKVALADTQAAAVILRAADAPDCPVAALLSDDPYATYARMAAVVCPPPSHAPGTHSTAVIADDADIDTTAHIAARAVVEAGARIGANTYVGPGCLVGRDCEVGRDGTLHANVTLLRRVSVGDRAVIHPGVVIGADGFGNAMTPDGWIKSAAARRRQDR